jgi:hypothetical protein
MGHETGNHTGRGAYHEPGRDPGPELPTDPFPDWHHFTAAHPLHATEPDDLNWPAPLDDPFPEFLLLHGA